MNIQLVEHEHSTSAQPVERSLVNQFKPVLATSFPYKWAEKKYYIHISFV